MNRVRGVHTLLAGASACFGLVLCLGCGGLEFPLNVLGLPGMLLGFGLYGAGLICTIGCAVSLGWAGLRAPGNLAGLLLAVLACSPCWLTLAAGPTHGLYACQGEPVLCVAQDGRYRWVGQGEMPWSIASEGRWLRTGSPDNDVEFDGQLGHTDMTPTGSNTITLHGDDVVLVRLGPCAP